MKKTFIDNNPATLFCWNDDFWASTIVASRRFVPDGNYGPSAATMASAGCSHQEILLFILGINA
jgi:hypothetical protein